ncbi:MAG: laccase domain-containing protein [bacterium]|nr:laccase domain-containing protein [bacterium]
MKSQIKIFETGINEGIMSRNKKFYPIDTPQEKINRLFLNARQKAGKIYGFDGKKVFQANQKTATNGITYEDGKYVILTEKNMQKEDFWFEDLPADILIISNKFPNIVVGNQMADCPIVIAEDRKLGVTALSHCGATYINRKLPIQTIKALQKAYNSDPKNIYVHITSCASRESYIYDKYPAWATDKEIWQDSIIKKDDMYHIDMLNAIKKQLNKIGITNITYSQEDTVKSPKFYSHIAATNGEESKKGQNFVGFFYLKPEK